MWTKKVHRGALKVKTFILPDGVWWNFQGCYRVFVFNFPVGVKARQSRKAPCIEGMHSNSGFFSSAELVPVKNRGVESGNGTWIRLRLSFEFDLPARTIFPSVWEVERKLYPCYRLLFSLLFWIRCFRLCFEFWCLSLFYLFCVYIRRKKPFAEWSAHCVTSSSLLEREHTEFPARDWVSIVFIMQGAPPPTQKNPTSFLRGDSWQFDSRYEVLDFLPILRIWTKTVHRGDLKVKAFILPDGVW